MKRINTIFIVLAIILAYYVTTEYAKKPEIEKKYVFATVGLWKREEFKRTLQEDALRKLALKGLMLKKNLVNPQQ